MARTGWSPSKRFAAALILLAGVLSLGVVLLPVLPAIGFAALLAYLLNPVVHLFQKRLHLTRAWAVRLTYFLFLLLLVNVPAWSGAVLLNQIDNLLLLLRGVAASIATWLSDPITLPGFRLEPERILDALANSFQSMLSTTSTGSLSLLSGVTTNLLWVVVVLVMLYYLLKDGPALKGWIVSLAPPAEQGELASLLEEADAIWSRFLRIQVLMFLFLTLLTVLGSLAVIWLYRALLGDRSVLVLILLLIAMYTLLQQLDNLWLRPHFLGRSLQLHSGVVFLGLIAGFLVAGFLGALFAVPAIASARVVGRYLQRKIGNRPAPPTPQAAATTSDPPLLPAEQN